jgi:hypothetical protein
MSRSLTTAVADEVAKPAIMPVFFVEAEFSGGPIQLWTGMGSASWDGKTWTGLGYLLNLGPLSDTRNIEANGLSISLSGVPAELLSIATAEFIQGRACTVWLAVLDTQTYQIIPDPVRLNRARMDTISYARDGQTATITVTVENGLIDLSKPNVRRYTHEDQQRLFPGDLGLEFVAKLQGQEVAWGRPGPSGIGTRTGNER